MKRSIFSFIIAMLIAVLIIFFLIFLMILFPKFFEGRIMYYYKLVRLSASYNNLIALMLSRYNHRKFIDLLIGYKLAIDKGDDEIKNYFKKEIEEYITKLEEKRIFVKISYKDESIGKCSANEIVVYSLDNNPIFVCIDIR